MVTRVVILGAGGFARETLDVFDAINQHGPAAYDVVGFVSEVESDHGRELNGKPVLGGFDWFESGSDRRQVSVICGVGSPAVRHRLIDRARARGLSFASAIHPRATATRWVRFGTGVVVTAGVVLTNQITVGDHVHLNLNVTVGHDTTIGDFCTLAPGVHVSGNVTLGAGTEIGTGAVILQKLSLGAWSVVGGGAVVTQDLPGNCTAVGIPAKVIKTRAEGWWRA